MYAANRRNAQISSTIPNMTTVATFSNFEVGGYVKVPVALQWGHGHSFVSSCHPVSLLFQFKPPFRSGRQPP